MQVLSALQSRLSAVLTHEAAQTFLGFALLFACAQIIIPLTPVPITLQTLAVMIIGLTFSTRPALNAVAIYLVAGALGLPVFNLWSGGMAKLAGPTGGYLVGFFAAVIVMTTFRKFFSSSSFLVTLSNCVLGTAVIFAFGIAWLSQSLGLTLAIELGLLPFLFPGAIKALMLCGSLHYLRSKN